MSASDQEKPVRSQIVQPNHVQEGNTEARLLRATRGVRVRAGILATVFLPRALEIFPIPGYKFCLETGTIFLLEYLQ